MNIREKFLQLTQKTYPYGTEGQLEKYLPSGAQKDAVGNYFLKVGQSKTMFTCHLDTSSYKSEPVTHVIGSKFIKSDGTTILGADDKAGMTILLYMIEKGVPGLYYFFIGEESGCIGSSAAARSLDFGGYNKCISFDRRGYDSVITEQFGGKCSSDEFASELAKRLNSSYVGFKFRPDPTGIYTDSASFTDIIPECTNISVGYFDEHRNSERQDIIFLERLCEALVKIDFETLPIVREPGDSGYYSAPKSSTNYIEYDDLMSIGNGVNSFYLDTITSEILNVWVGEELWSVRLKKERILEESSLIYDWAIRQDIYYGLEGVDWNGRSAFLICDGVYEYVGDRSDLSIVIDELNYLSTDKLEMIERIK
jgi:hypothetical protein